MRIVVGSDHAGYILKQEVGEALRQAGHDVLDVGTSSTAPVDYPDSAEAVGKAGMDGRAERGVVILGRRVRAAGAASKPAGIRAAGCPDTYSARQGGQDD